VTRVGERRSSSKVLVGKHEEETLGRPRRKWEDNNKIDPQAVGCGAMDSIDLSLNRDRWQAVVNGVMNLFFYKSEVILD